MICHDYDFDNLIGKPDNEKIHLIYCLQDFMTY